MSLSPVPTAFTMCSILDSFPLSRYLVTMSGLHCRSLTRYLLGLKMKRSDKVLKVKGEVQRRATQTQDQNDPKALPDGRSCDYKFQWGFFTDTDG